MKVTIHCEQTTNTHSFDPIFGDCRLPNGRIMKGSKLIVTIELPDDWHGYRLFTCQSGTGLRGCLNRNIPGDELIAPETLLRFARENLHGVRFSSHQ